MRTLQIERLENDSSRVSARNLKILGEQKKEKRMTLGYNDITCTYGMVKTFESFLSFLVIRR